MLEIIFVTIGGVLTLGMIKIFLALAAFEENKIHSPYLREEEHHRKMAMLQAHEDPRYFP